MSAKKERKEQERQLRADVALAFTSFTAARVHYESLKTLYNTIEALYERSERDYTIADTAFSNADKKLGTFLASTYPAKDSE